MKQYHQISFLFDCTEFSIDYDSKCCSSLGGSLLFMYLALHLLGILCITGGVVAEKKHEESINYMCVMGLILLLTVQGIMKYSSFSLQDFSLLIDVLP